MPEIVNCPQCERKLRVPDELLGQAVKCPTCGRTFTASVAAPAPPAPPPPQAAEPDLLQQRYEQAAPREPVPTYPLAPEKYAEGASYSDGYGDYESEVNRRRLALRGSALAAVSGPATALMVAAILGIIIHVLIAVGQIGALAAGGGGDRQMINAVSGCVGGIIATTLGMVCIIGTQKMKRLESYGWSLAASILMMIPCFSPCCLLGLPFGIWALVVLNDPQVKNAFQS